MDNEIYDGMFVGNILILDEQHVVRHFLHKNLQ